MAWDFWNRRGKMAQDEKHNQRPQADDFGEGELYEKFRELFRREHHNLKELIMATQGTLDALKTATDDLNTATAASVAATEALIASAADAGGADEQSIKDATDSIKGAQAQLDAETAKAQQASGSQPTENARRAQLK